MARLTRTSRVIKYSPWLLVFALAFIIACGTAAPEQETPPTSPPTQAQVTASTPVPTVIAESTTAPSAPEKPAGTLNVGHSDIGPFTFHPTNVGNPQIYLVSTIIGEGLVRFDKDKEVQPIAGRVLAYFPTWTFNIRQGVQFHKGYGELTAGDVAYSYRDGWGNNTLHGRGPS